MWGINCFYGHNGAIMHMCNYDIVNKRPIFIYLSKTDVKKH